MKKLLFAAAFALFATANAQTEKGSWVVGASSTLGFNSTSSKVKANGHSVDGPKVSTFTITPSAGYFVIDKLAVGLDLGYNSATTKFDGDKYTASTFGIMPTGTYYFTDNKTVKPYLGAGVGYASTKEKEGNYSVTVDGLAWKVKGGIAYFIATNTALDLGLGYTQFSNKENGVTTNVNNFGVNLGFSIFFK